jgi:hypothetical protein
LLKIGFQLVSKDEKLYCEQEQGAGRGWSGVVFRSRFVMGFGFVTRFRFVYGSGFGTGSRFVKGFGSVTLWIRVVTFLQLLFRLRQIGHCTTVNANCQIHLEIFCDQPMSWYDGPASWRGLRLVAVRSKHKKASVSYSATGCSNMSCSHASFSDMPKGLSKLEAES